MTRLMYIGNQVTYLQDSMKVIFEAARQAGIEIYWAGNFSHYNGDINEIPCKRIQIDFCRHPLLSSRNFKAIGQLKDSIREYGIEAVHCNTTIGSFCGRIAAHRAGVPAVMYTAHGLPYYEGAPAGRKVFKAIEYHLARYTDYAVAMNREDYDEFMKMKLRKKNVALINGVGIPLRETDPEIRREKRKEFGIPEDTPVIVSVGRLEKVKGYHVSLKAFSAIENRDSVLLICGVGPEKENLEALCGELSISDRVRFLGFRNDVFDILQASDIYLLTSYYEGLPRSLMEAMNAGLPSVVSDARGNTDLIRASDSGIIVGRDDTAATAAALNELIGDPEKRRRFGNNGAAVIPQYSSEAIIRQYTDIYRHFLECCFGGKKG